MKKQFLLIIFIAAGFLFSNQMQAQISKEKPQKKAVTKEAEGDRGIPYADTGNTVPRLLIAFTLSDRKLENRPDPKTVAFKETGTVVLQLTIDRDGSIISHRIISATSTTLRVVAVKVLEDIRFNKSATAPPEQFGRITLKFRGA
jgi:hypothetical protein